MSSSRHLYHEPVTHETDMVDEIAELKCALGPAAGHYNDTQLRQLSREIDLMAEFLLDLYVLKHSEKRKAKTGSFDAVV